MSTAQVWTLVDAAHDLYRESFLVTPEDVKLPVHDAWSVQKRTLRGGVSDGVDVVRVHNGALCFSVLPTRGMGLWRGDYRGIPLGWASPVRGPVHPRFVHPTAHGGAGWLAGFDEWLCRCGLASNGPPGDDVRTDGGGRSVTTHLTLHGRVANTPASVVKVAVNPDPPYEIRVMGQVEEGGLFLPNLRLTTTYTTTPGSSRIVVHDAVENRSDQPVEMQLLYHLNFGPPLLEAGSTFSVAIREMAPQTLRAAEGVADFDRYDAPQAGFAEQVFLIEPLSDQHGQAQALLQNASGDLGVRVRWNVNELPCFAVWKNTGGVADGYVTGLEPATNFPNFKGFERQQGRVPLLAPHGRWEATWSVKVLDRRGLVDQVRDEINAVQNQRRPVIHRAPVPRFSPG